MRGPTKPVPGENARPRNRAAVLKFALESPGIDRTRLAELTGLTNPAVTRIAQELILAGVLSETGLLDGKGRGRKRMGLQIEASGGYVLGLSVLAFNTGVALSDLSGRVIAQEDVSLSDLSKPSSTLDEIAAAAHRLIDEHVDHKQRVLGLGAAIAGYFDESGEILAHSPYLGWPRFNVKQSLQQRFDMPVAIDNVNRTIAVAEARIGCCKGIRDLILIRAAIGLGGAVIGGGELLLGDRNQAGQIGHIPAKLDGKTCVCGKRGCLTTVASGQAVLESLGLNSGSGGKLAQAVNDGEHLRRVLQSTKAVAKDALYEAGTALGFHSAGAILLNDPKVVVLTGPLGRNADYSKAFTEQLREAGVTAEIFTAHSHDILQPATAAAGLALSSHFYSPSLNLWPLIESSPTSVASDPTATQALVL
jgi:predicted NBD/HSP70 family sugar kinase